MFKYKDKTYDNVWFTSDEHYGSDRHITLSNRKIFQNLKKEKQIRQYKARLEQTNEITESVKNALLRSFTHSVYGSVLNTPVERMTTSLIEKHNEVVGENDLVFHLGDFGDYRYAKDLKGYHVLILGNYEYKDIKDEYADSFDKFRDVLVKNYNFIDVIPDYDIDSKELDNIFSKSLTNEICEIHMVHEPSKCHYNYRMDQYIKVPDCDNKIIMNLFGHIHEKGKIKRCGLNVGVDCNHFYPVSSDEVEFYLYAILHYYDDEVFC